MFAGGCSWRTRRFHRCLLGLVVLGFALRLLVCWQFRQHPVALAPPSGTDMATYLGFARDILTGKWPAVFYYQPFYYAVFLPVVLFLGHGSIWGVFVSQALVGALCIWFAGLLGARLFGRRAGLAGAALLCLARFHIFYTPFALMAVLQSLWVVLVAWVGVRAWQRNALWGWGLVGVVTGLGALTRGNLLLFLLPLLGLLGWRNRGRWGRTIAAGSLCLGLYALLQLPFAVHNTRATGRLVGPSTAKDAVLALGNTPESAPGGLAYPATYQRWMEAANRSGPERVPVTRQVRRWVRREPLAFAELKFRMLLLFWYEAEIPNNLSYPALNGASSIVRAPWLVDFGVLATAGLAGMLLWLWRSRRHPGRLLLYGLVGLYCGGTVLFYILARFRLPLVPLLAVFGGAAVVRFWDLGRGVAGGRHRWSVLVLPGVGFVLAVGLVWFGFPLYQGCAEARVMRWVRPHGVLAEHGEARHLGDHGPQVMGGWTLVPLPAGGAGVRKAFRPPASLASGALLPRALRVCLVAEAAGPCRLVIRAGERAVGERVVGLQGRGVPEWCEVELMAGVPVGDPPVFTVWLMTERAGVNLVVDSARQYGRTSTLTGQGTPLPEAVMELVYR